MANQMIKALRLCFTGLATAVAGSNTFAYEIETHAAMSLAAAKYSNVANLTRPSILERLGLLEMHNLRDATGTTLNMFGRRYFDFVGSVVTERYAGSPGAGADKYENRAFTDIGQDGHFLTLYGWIARGAIREDDYPSKEIPADDLCQSNEAPCVRVINHFFDPYNNVSFTQSPVGTVIPERSPDWGIGTTNAFATEVTPNLSRSNHFSAFDAREAMYRALTLRRTPAIGTTYVDIFSSGSGTDAERASVQRGYWATTFRGLGDLIHLVQDMAQPQHTRSDMHAGPEYDSGMFGHLSFYEKYVDARVKREPAFSPWENVPSVPVTPLLVEANPYPIPRFNTYPDYWSSSPGSGSLSGKGLADYSNRGFYSANTNIGSGVNYPQPPQQVSADSLVAATGLSDIVNKPVTGSVKFVMASVYDSVLNEPTTGVRLSSFGAFDQFLKASGKPSAYTLNKYNLDDMADLLVPRAVAYSTGVLDYFFRGKLAVTLPVEKVYSVADYSSNGGFTKIRALIKNNTANIVAPDGTPYPQSTSKTAGTLVAVLRYRGGVDSSCLAFPSLQGAPEYDPSQPDTPIWRNEAKCRTPSIRDPAGEVLPKMTVSDQVNLADFQGVLPAAGIDDAPFPIVFNFQQPLPFNAVDVELQVVYRGPLGAEKDGIAVGFEQLSEPTFFDFHNALDCGDPLPSCGRDCGTYSSSVNLPYSIEVLGPVDAEVVDLPTGRFARVAFLTRATLTDKRGDNTLRYVVNNQDFAAEQYVTDEATGDILEIWPTGVKQTAPLMKVRKLAAGGDLLTWRANVIMGASTFQCVDYADCFARVYDSCPALVDDQPWPVKVWFPDSKPPQ